MKYAKFARAMAFAAAVALAPPGFSQRGANNNNPPGSNNNNGTQPGGGPAGTSVPGGMQGNQSTQIAPPQTQRTIFITGRVMTDDGVPPQDLAIIETVCNGVAHGQAYTDSKGRFDFELGRDNHAIQDASENHIGPFGSNYAWDSPSTRAPGISIAESMMNSCEIRARIPGYRSETVNLAMVNNGGNTDVGSILVHRLAKVEGHIVSATTLAAPKQAQKAYEKASDAQRKNKPAEAMQQLRKAVEIYPEFALAWTALGKAQVTANDLDGARASFAAAIRADQKFVNPYFFLAAIQAATRQWEDVRQTTETALRLDGYDYPQPYYLNALAEYNLKNVDAAEKNARQAQKLDTNHQFPRCWQLLSIILATRGQYAAAAEQMKLYLEYSPQANDVSESRAQLARMEQLATAQPTAAPAQPATASAQPAAVAVKEPK